jgi:hypothetical protein
MTDAASQLINRHHKNVPHRIGVGKVSRELATEPIVTTETARAAKRGTLQASRHKVTP